MQTVEKQKGIRWNLMQEISFKELCESLDKQHERYLSWEAKLYSAEEIWNNIKNRKGTFLTSK